MTNTASLLMMKSLKEMEDRILFYHEKGKNLCCILVYYVFQREFL